MRKIEATTIQVKNNVGTYNEIHPVTTTEQVVGWDVGELYGPYDIVISPTDWKFGVATKPLPNVMDTDIVFCNKVLTGDNLEELRAQKSAYNLISPYDGIESLNNEIKFTCDGSTPDIDITVELWWTR